jgi:hypothetical protein
VEQRNASVKVVVVVVVVVSANAMPLVEGVC